MRLQKSLDSTWFYVDEVYIIIELEGLVVAFKMLETNRTTCKLAGLWVLEHLGFEAGKLVMQTNVERCHRASLHTVTFKLCRMVNRQADY